MFWHDQLMPYMYLQLIEIELNDPIYVAIYKLQVTKIEMKVTCKDNGTNDN